MGPFVDNIVNGSSRRFHSRQEEVDKLEPEVDCDFLRCKIVEIFEKVGLIEFRSVIFPASWRNSQIAMLPRFFPSTTGVIIQRSQ